MGNMSGCHTNLLSCCENHHLNDFNLKMNGQTACQELQWGFIMATVISSSQFILNQWGMWVNVWPTLLWINAEIMGCNVDDVIAQICLWRLCLSSQGELRQMTFIMGDANAAKDHCAPHQHMCEPLKGHSFLETESSTEVQLWTWCTWKQLYELCLRYGTFFHHVL